jgi:hypothetical protein
VNGGDNISFYFIWRKQQVLPYLFWRTPRQISVGNTEII